MKKVDIRQYDELKIFGRFKLKMIKSHQIYASGFHLKDEIAKNYSYEKGNRRICIKKVI